MAVKFNLLPPELSVSKRLSSTLKILRALDVIGIAVFLIFGIGLGAFFIISYLSLKNINSTNDKLKSQVTAQQASEQKIVLLKDRIKKIMAVQKMPNILPSLEVAEPFLTNLSSLTSISQMQIDATAIDLSLNFRANADLSTFLSAIEVSKVFKTVTMSTFSLSPTTGYLIDVNMVKK
jgi:Tfp pilus assembly protein PilN